MALPHGTCLGAFEIVAPLGAGGMGEVYRARDHKLDREVAVKVLPQSLRSPPPGALRARSESRRGAHSSEHPVHLRLRRAERARLRRDGASRGGDTARQARRRPDQREEGCGLRASGCPGPFRSAREGIVHRDLKPENLFVTRDGLVKILDFGLAKRVETLGAGTSAPTRSGHTEPGTIMGTPGYMSPEQVKGFPVDHRADIFSFGAILYELLSGKRAFKRETNTETMAAILRDEPPDLLGSGRSISPALDRIVRHCLEKDLDHRFQSARRSTRS